MENKDETMMLVFGLARLVDGTIDVSGCDDRCCEEFLSCCW